jgi:hypothetical protein
MTKLLVGLGNVHQGNKTNTIEIINLELISDQYQINFESKNKNCKNLPNFPNVAEGPIGGLDLQGGPIICGGDQKVYLHKKKNLKKFCSNTIFSKIVCSKLVSMLLLKPDSDLG